MRKTICLVAGWLSVIGMLWLLFIGEVKPNALNIIILVLMFLGSVFATAVDDKPRQKSNFNRN